MEKSIITTGKTLDLAIDAALKQLGMDRDSVSVEIIENAKSGFLGIGAVPAKVKVTYEAPDEAPAEPKPALSSASRSKPKKTFQPAQEQVVVPTPKPAAPMPPKPQDTVEKKENRGERKGDRKPKERKPQQNEGQKPQGEKKQPRPERKPQQPKTPAAPVEYKPAEPGSVEERIETFIKGLLEHMGSDAVPHAYKSKEEGYCVDLVGEDLGMLIGRRGDTLDAIQHLTNYTINRDASKRIRITVDAENYRLKREDSLRRLANKVAAKVVKTRRNITLEPMNAYERHVIHAALQDTAYITTYSTGTEPNRRLVVAYARDKVAGQTAQPVEEDEE